LRVIAGKYRSRQLKAPKTMNIRPTSDKVKGALFNMLEPLEGCSVVDFYSGTGNLGIEALSRRAESVIFVDNGFEGLKLIKENLETLGIVTGPQGPAKIMNLEVGRAFHSLYQEKLEFDILLADPPYEVGVLKRIQHLLMQYPILKPGGILAVEHEAKDTELEPDFPFPLVRQKKYGDTLLSLFKNATNLGPVGLD